jgi:L-iditol 2-dehydrogenase
LIEPLASALHALDVADIQPGQRILIVGSGTMGLLILVAAKQRGVQYAAVCNRSLPKLDIARLLGADEAIHTPESISSDAVSARVGERRIDAVFDTVANSASIACGLSVLKRGRTLVLVGTPVQTVETDFSKILINELKVAGSLKYRHNFPEAIDMLSGDSGRKTDFDALISRKFPLKDIQQAFEEITANSAKYIKCLIEL